ncbi:Fic family protein [Candidatus Woesearchaeota archaeon]|nr:Fic family protein [Candidatus Woesearchaeota archaeon]
MFVRKKNVNGREYYYLVESTRIADNKWKKIERYIGLNPPSAKDVTAFGKEFNKVALFFAQNNKTLDEIQTKYQNKIKQAATDELYQLENEIITQFTYDTNRIEGSTLSYKDTKMLLEEGISPKEKPIRDIKEAENHKQAFLYMKQQLKGDISKEFILELHRLLKNTVTEDAGKFRTGQVRVGTLIPISAKLLETELDNLLDWYHNNKNNLHPLETASEFHSVFERLHPFFDGNGRVGRLLLNYILLKNKYPLLIVQNKNKRRYYTALKKADDGNILPMLKYLLFELQEQAKNW